MKALSSVTWLIAAVAVVVACERKHADVHATAEQPSQTAPGAKPDPHAHDEHAKTAPPPTTAAPIPSTLGPPQNAVQAEMRLLHETTRDWVSAIAQNELANIPAGISKVHTARMATEKALEKGEYKLLKAGTDLEQFKKQDETFHDELVKLLKASKANDLPAATKQLGTVLEGCTSCHVKYRF